jgi:hypothetical protein
MLLETPKGGENGQSLDALNLATLRGLLATPKDRTARKAE